MKKLFLALCIVFVASVYLAAPVLADDCPSSGNPDTAVCNPDSNIFIDLSSQGYSNTFGGILMFIVEAVLAILGILSIAFIIIGGFQYVTSRGDEEAAAVGKKTLTNAIIGLVIAILSYIIVTVIINALKGSV